MRRLLLTVVLLVLLVAPAPAMAAPKRAPASTPGLQTVIQDDGIMLFRPRDEVDAAAARMKALGIDRVRVTANWSTLTRGVDRPQKPEGFDGSDPGAYEQARWQGLDNAIRAIHGAGMKAIIDIGFWAPLWATTAAAGPRARENVDAAEYAAFARAVVLRYSGAFAPIPDPPGTPPPAPTADEDIIESLLQPIVPFPLPDVIPPARAHARASQTGAAVAPGEPLPKVDMFILWNEPNHPGLLLPQWFGDGRTPASPVTYRAMVRAAYPAIKAARKSAKVLIGNTSSTGGQRGRGAVAPLEFLRELACVDPTLKPRTTGTCEGFQTLPGDGWSHHPYSQNERPERVSDAVKEPGDVRLADLPVLARTLDRLVRMGRLAPANRAIWLTEFGYETKGVPGRPRVNELQQARWLTWAEYIADAVPAVRSFAQFLLRDQPPAPERVSSSSARPFGEYSTGLLHTSGTEKIAARTFLAGLFVQLRRGGREVVLYGRLRLGPGRKTIILQRQVEGGAWRRLERMSIDGRRAFTRIARHRPGALYRLTYPGPNRKRRAGLALRPVPAAK